MKKLIAILLAVVLVFALTSVAFAADAEETTAADILNALGLFIGTGTDAEGKPIYDLDRAPNRMEAVTMLVRLLGKEEEANAGAWEIPFTDVKDWAKPYVGYAYANGLTKGYSEKTFGGTDAVTAAQYLTFILRALGYSSDSDFRWDAAWELTNELGITAGEYDAAASFDRGDVFRAERDREGRGFLHGGEAAERGRVHRGAVPGGHGHRRLWGRGRGPEPCDELGRGLPV